MAAIFYLTRVLERRLGNAKLGVIAAVILFLSVTGAASASGSTGSDDIRTGSSISSTTAAPLGSATSVATTVTTAVAPTTVTTSPQLSRNGLDGYAAVNFTVAPDNKAAKNYCGLLAATSSQQAAGLMNRTDLGGYDGMIFPFQADTTAAFYMANVPVALSVAWFDGNGKFVSSADMNPCKTVASQCPLYKATGPYRSAIETLKGGLTNLGVGGGSVLSVGQSGPC